MSEPFAELIDFSRPASRTVTRTRLAEVVDEALGIAKYYQGTKQRRIETEIPAGLPPVMVVRDYLTQVILNLVLNAIDATDDEGRIQLRAVVSSGSIELTVEDDGRGISLADRCRLFSRFSPPNHTAPAWDCSSAVRCSRSSRGR